MKIGLCYRDFIHEEWIEGIFPHIDFIEIMPDITDVKTMKKLVELSNYHKVSIGIHSLKSSLGSKEGVHTPSLNKYFFQHHYCNAEYFSDHAAFSHLQGKYLSTVFPISYSKKSVEILAKNLETVKEYFPDLILVENITQNQLSSDNELTEAQFFKTLMDVTSKEIKLMFDVTNAYVTSFNNNISFTDYINEYPFDDVICVHVSGFTRLKNGFLRDSHANGLDQEILDSLKLILKKCNPKYLLLERDFGVHSLEDTLIDIQKLKEASLENALV
ncbi:hypothetical protein A374_06881 [Fictibacillus macauensis ZFHKF-1]|uniref:DUF692 domain-containing protein n=1 Tax=Fictibacillus macauensis ZFHKF-1 TaxID=1196324 RepID=I8AKE4_9BACL|nr:DUF692 family multinuclear iron-containing protein [Fictibacillus macauensis]EIT86024.1 hypothetical protein A374_06881 [Fictibacillus macauensis ZFHKF-1]